MLRLWIGNGPEQTRLYAGNPEYPALLAARSVTMRPVRTISRKGRGDVGSGILRDHTPSSHRTSWDEDMIHPLWRHRDKVNYNGPKVSESLAPVVSNGGVSIRLYAGNPGESDGTQ